jgi:chemotaxis family two-component system response regulator Rcp1
MSEAPRATPIDILLVEDNPGDVRLITETFQEGKISNRLSVVEDGVEALAFLRRQSPYDAAPRPDIILLDLSLPRKSGQELLAEIKQDPELKRTPVVVITSSEAEKDILEAYNQPRELLPDQAAGPGAIHGRGPVRGGVLACRRQVATEIAGTSWPMQPHPLTAHRARSSSSRTTPGTRA